MDKDVQQPGVKRAQHVILGVYFLLWAQQMKVIEEEDYPGVSQAGDAAAGQGAKTSSLGKRSDHISDELMQNGRLHFPFIYN